MMKLISFYAILISATAPTNSNITVSSTTGDTAVSTPELEKVFEHNQQLGESFRNIMTSISSINTAFTSLESHISKTKVVIDNITETLKKIKKEQISVVKKWLSEHIEPKAAEHKNLGTDDLPLMMCFILKDINIETAGVVKRVIEDIEKRLLAIQKDKIDSLVVENESVNRNWQVYNQNRPADSNSSYKIMVTDDTKLHEMVVESWAELALYKMFITKEIKRLELLSQAQADGN